MTWQEVAGKAIDVALKIGVGAIMVWGVTMIITTAINASRIRR